MKKIPAVALVTGAARRIGAEIAETLHGAGMNVIVHYHRSKREAEQLCKKLNTRRPGSVYALSQHLTTSVDQLNVFIKEAAQYWGRLDVLVNNASTFYPTKLGRVKESAWEDLFASNLKAPFFLSQAAHAYLKKSKGSIINICDIHADKPMRDYSVYCCAKAGLVMLTKALAKEFAPHVRVNAVSPGAILWPEGKSMLTASQKKSILSKIPLARHGSAKEIANSVLFLVQSATYVTGQIIAVDGGRSLD
ncbi:MAG: pteridine reductase [Gammaproteobacteria bacterium]|nr:pteridine reductase [Gammaproteobacteria bacterium]